MAYDVPESIPLRLRKEAFPIIEFYFPFFPLHEPASTLFRLIRSPLETEANSGITDFGSGDSIALNALIGKT